MTMMAFFFGDQLSPLQILQRYWAILPVAFFVSLLATPVCRRVALRLGVLDMPDAKVKTHNAPTAYLGGVGILAGFTAGILIGFFILFTEHGPAGGALPCGWAVRYPDWLILAGIGFGAALACGVGLLDDLLDITPWQKLAGQTIAACALLAVGIKPNITGAFAYFGFQIHPALELAIAIPIVVFFILGATNSLNLLDGIDGLCTGVTAIVTSGFMLLALALATWGHSPVGDPVRLVLCLAMTGAALGFLPMNRHPARIFMGDAGSMLLGFVCGAMMLLFAEKIGAWTIAPLIIFGLPILDTAVALVRRLVNKRPLFQSDRGHLYDQLMDRGSSVPRTVIICYALAALYAVIGIIVSTQRLRYALAALVLIVIASAWAVTKGGFLQMGSHDQDKRLTEPPHQRKKKPPSLLGG